MQWARQRVLRRGGIMRDLTVRLSVLEIGLKQRDADRLVCVSLCLGIDLYRTFTVRAAALF
jgi:hypothetical protein